MLKMGLIGLGKWGQNHLRIFSGLNNCQLMGAADADPTTKPLADKYGVKFFTDYKELLPNVDAVSIVAPTNIHFDIVKTCLLEGKHVLVEKPLTIKPPEAEELVNLAKEKKLVLAVGHLFRYNPAVLKLKELVKDVGKIHYITTRYIHSTKPPRKDSGVIFNFASHLIDVLLFIFGEPKKVFCKRVNYLSKEREDCALCILDYGNFIANLEMSWFHPLKKRDMWVIGSKQKIYADLLEQRITVYPIEVGQDKTNSKPPLQVQIEKHEPLKLELEAFCRAVENGDGIPNTGEEGSKVVRICELCENSAKESREVNYGSTAM